MILERLDSPSESQAEVEAAVMPKPPNEDGSFPALAAEPRRPITARSRSTAKHLVYRAARLALDFTGLALSVMAKAGISADIDHVDTSEIEIQIDELPERFEGIRIAQLSDIHFGSFLGVEGVERFIRLTRALRPDLILLTGDFVNRWLSESRAVIPLLAKLDAPLGVFGVLGNHDHYAGADETQRMLWRYGIKTLDHDLEPIQVGGDRLWLLGSGDYIRDKRYDLNARLERLPADEPRIVLAHNPDSADLPRTRRVDLMISGHTHGGQVRFPRIGAPILPVYNRRYDQGLFRVGEMQLFVSRGLGMVGLPLRLNCPAQLPILQLVASGNEPTSR